MKAWVPFSVAAAVSIAAACSADKNTGGRTIPQGNGSGGASASGGVGGSGAILTGGAGSGTGGQGAGFGATFGTVIDAGDPDAPCQAVQQQATKRLGGEADIIWVIDNSGSMFDETVGVQNNMNFFSQFIAGTGIDVRVVLISEAPGLEIIFTFGVCIDPPLGAPGACPTNGDDTLLPGYMHWRRMVNSNDSLFVIQDTFNGWRGQLRPNATKTFVVVTDDESSPPPTTDEFIAWVNSQPEFQNALWRFSGFFCMPSLPGTGNCFGTGFNYQYLVDQTGGVAASMANPDWTVIFQQLADAVVADAVPVECEWVIPDPGDEDLDPDRVNVKYTGAPGEETIFGVENAAACPAPGASGVPDYKGWYFDDNVNPTRLIACPEACTEIQADDTAAIQVLFGCKREPPPVVE